MPPATHLERLASALELTGEIDLGLGLDWGGVWKTLPDRPHFQLKK